MKIHFILPPPGMGTLSSKEKVDIEGGRTDGGGKEVGRYNPYTALGHAIALVFLILIVDECYSRRRLYFESQSSHESTWIMFSI